MDPACELLHGLILSFMGIGVWYLRYLRSQINEIKDG